MTKKIIFSEEDYVKLATHTPHIIGVLYYEVLDSKGGKVPRRDSVIKRYKEVVEKSMEVSFKKLSEYQQKTLIKTAEDAYYGIREAETEE